MKARTDSSRTLRSALVACLTASLLCAAIAGAREVADRRSSFQHWESIPEGSDTLCGRAFGSPPALDRTGLGPITVDLTIEAIRNLCPEARDTIDRFGEPRLVLYAFGATIMLAGELNPDVQSLRRAAGEILAIQVVGGSIRTPEGLGSGSTLTELIRAYGGDALYLSCRGKLAKVVFLTQPHLHFVFEECVTDSERRASVWRGTRRAIGVAIEIPV